VQICSTVKIYARGDSWWTGAKTNPRIKTLFPRPAAEAKGVAPNAIAQIQIKSHDVCEAVARFFDGRTKMRKRNVGVPPAGRNSPARCCPKRGGQTRTRIRARGRTGAHRRWAMTYCVDQKTESPRPLGVERTVRRHTRVPRPSVRRCMTGFRNFEGLWCTPLSGKGGCRVSKAAQLVAMLHPVRSFVAPRARCLHDVGQRFIRSMTVGDHRGDCSAGRRGRRSETRLFGPPAAESSRISSTPRALIVLKTVQRPLRELRRRWSRMHGTGRATPCFSAAVGHKNGAEFIIRAVCATAVPDKRLRHVSDVSFFTPATFSGRRPNANVTGMSSKLIRRCDKRIRRQTGPHRRTVVDCSTQKNSDLRFAVPF